jgi:hypothetical protein
MIAIVVIALLGAAVLGLGGWVIWMLGHPRTVPGPERVREVPVPGPVRIKEVSVPGPVRTKEVPVPGPVRIKEIPVPGPERVKEVRVVEYLRSEDVPVSAIGSELAEPGALPEPPGALPDSAVDGVRLGELTVRAGAVRGVRGRGDAALRRQVAEISILDMFVPPALLSVVAAGRSGARFSQVGAAQCARSVHTRLAAHASELDELWRDATGGDATSQRRLDGLLRIVAASLTDPLEGAARRRDTTVDAVATQLTCLLSRIGDTPRRAHLAFGVGAGPVLVAPPGVGWPGVERTGRDADYLPQDHKTTWSRLLWTTPGDLVVVCTSSAGSLLDSAGDQLRAGWAEPPSLIGYLYQLSGPDGSATDDRAVVCLWEGRAGAAG